MDDKSLDDNKNIDFIETFEKNGDLENYIKQSIKEDYVEFEVVYGDTRDKTKNLSKSQFLNLRQTFTNDTLYTDLGETNSLDIRTELRNKHKSVSSSMRLTLEGLDQIKSYCKSDCFLLYFRPKTLHFDSRESLFIRIIDLIVSIVVCIYIIKI